MGGTRPFGPQVRESPWLRGRCPRGLMPSQPLTSGLFSDGWGAYQWHGAARCQVLGDKWQMPSASPAPCATSHVTSGSAAHFWFSLHQPDRGQERNRTETDF